MTEGWKCGECGVIYAPFIKECRCSVKIIGNIIGNDACFHDWAGPGHKCTKCGLIHLGGITFDSPSATICQHTWSEEGQSTGGQYCTNCGMVMPVFSSSTKLSDEMEECKL